MTTGSLSPMPIDGNGNGNGDGEGKGIMEILMLKTLLNSISSFSLLSSNSNVKAELVQRYCRKIDEILKLFKPVFDEAVASEIALDEQLKLVLEEVDAVVNEARELIGNWHQMMSKVYFVLQIELIITRIRASALDMCQQLDSLFLSPSINFTSACIEKIQHLHYECTSDVIKEAIRDQIDKVVPRSEILEKISNSLSLTSNQELLMELVALYNLKAKVGCGANHVEVENVDHMIALVSHMRDCFVKVKQLHRINGVPIPADFCCPLSLDLMSDPVIVASGQTYERAFIRKWFDEGFNVCPKTHQTLGQTNMIPNYTVKALIANWCESNDIKLPDPIRSIIVNLPSAFLSSTGSTANDCNIPHVGHSPRSNHPGSPESNRLMMNSHKDLISSNGVHQETYLHEKTSSPNHHLHSTESTLQTTNGCEASFAKMSIADSEGKKDSSLEERHVSSGDQISNKSKQDHCQASVSASIAVPNNDYPQRAEDANLLSQVSSDLTHYSSDASGDVSTEDTTVSAPQREPENPPRLSEAQSQNQTIWPHLSQRFVPRIVSSLSMDSRPDLSNVETQVRKLIEDLKSDSVDIQRDATKELRLLAKHNMENRIIIANCGSINLLVGLLHSKDPKTQENAVTTLLNLSINYNNKTAIADAGAIDPLIHVLETGNPEAKGNSAATLFSLSVIEENRVKIGCSGAIKPLVELLGNGTPWGKKDAATALFNLSTCSENKIRIVEAGAVRHLVELMDPSAGLVDKAVAVLANLATIPEGRTRMGQEGGIPVLVDLVELGSSRGKEHAAAALLHLCTNSNRFCSMVLQEGAVPPLVALSQSGTPRAKEKALALLSNFRNQRHGNPGRA